MATAYFTPAPKKDSNTNLPSGTGIGSSITGGTIVTSPTGNKVIDQTPGYAPPLPNSGGGSSSSGGKKKSGGGGSSNGGNQLNQTPEQNLAADKAEIASQKSRNISSQVSSQQRDIAFDSFGNPYDKNSGQRINTLTSTKDQQKTSVGYSGFLGNSGALSTNLNVLFLQRLNPFYRGESGDFVSFSDALGGRGTVRGFQKVDDKDVKIDPFGGRGTSMDPGTNPFESGIVARGGTYEDLSNLREVNAGVPVDLIGLPPPVVESRILERSSTKATAQVQSRLEEDFDYLADFYQKKVDSGQDFDEVNTQYRLEQETLLRNRQSELDSQQSLIYGESKLQSSNIISKQDTARRSTGITGRTSGDILGSNLDAGASDIGQVSLFALGPAAVVIGSTLIGGSMAVKSFGRGALGEGLSGGERAGEFAKGVAGLALLGFGARSVLGPQRSFLRTSTGEVIKDASGKPLSVPSNMLERQYFRELQRDLQKETIKFGKVGQGFDDNLGTQTVDFLGRRSSGGIKQDVFMRLKPEVTEDSVNILGSSKGVSKISYRSIFGEKINLPAQEFGVQTLGPAQVARGPLSFIRGSERIAYPDKEATGIFGKLITTQKGTPGFKVQRFGAVSLSDEAGTLTLGGRATTARLVRTKEFFLEATEDGLFFGQRLGIKNIRAKVDSALFEPSGKSGGSNFITRIIQKGKNKAMKPFETAKTSESILNVQRKYSPFKVTKSADIDRPLTGPDVFGEQKLQASFFRSRGTVADTDEVLNSFVSTIESPISKSLGSSARITGRPFAATSFPRNNLPGISRSNLINEGRIKSPDMIMSLSPSQSNDFLGVISTPRPVSIGRSGSGAIQLPKPASVVSSALNTRQSNLQRTSQGLQLKQKQLLPQLVNVPGVGIGFNPSFALRPLIPPFKRPSLKSSFGKRSQRSGMFSSYTPSVTGLFLRLRLSQTPSEISKGQGYSPFALRGAVSSSNVSINKAIKSLDIDSKKGYKVLIKRRGKFVESSKSLLKNEAERYGKMLALKDLSASIKLVPTDERPSRMGVRKLTAREESAFRNYRISGGKKVYEKGLFIQRRSQRLSSTMEKEAIQSARRKKSRK